MKLFTFSGISGTLSGTNDGAGMIEFANEVVGAMPAGEKPDYDGIDDKDHFHSNVNFSTMLGTLESAVSLSGVDGLNEEASQLSPHFAEVMSDAVAADPSEDVLVLAHSQGTNNLTWTLLNLVRNNPDFFAQRSVRCALFDPKVGTMYMNELFGRFADPAQLGFLFFQSENDILGDQGMFIPKFITEFPHGNHIWVKGLNHTSIREWAMLNKPQRWLDLFGFLEYERAWNQKVIALKQETRAGQLGTMQITRLHNWVDQYAKDEMNLDKLTDALIGFLRGNLPTKFKSRA
jgi:hypothetical protein